MGVTAYGIGVPGSGGPWEWRAVTFNAQHAKLFNITRFQSWQEVDRFVSGDNM